MTRMATRNASLRHLRPNLAALVVAVCALTLAAATSWAQQTPVDKVPNESRGYSVFASYTGSANSLGQVHKLDGAVGYNFNRYVGIDVGLPVYFVHASDASVANGFASGNGIGNAYADLTLTFNNVFLNYATSLTVTAPTGDVDRGFSTGRFTYDWTNHFDRPFPLVRITPFANVGVANTVSDTHFFVRPFTSLGTVAHLEGGATARVFPMIHVGASLYDIIPSGQQKVFSKLIPRVSGMGSPQGHGRNGAFANAHESIGGPGLVSDNGASAWVSARVGKFAYLEAGYTRSMNYHLNTFEFGMGFDVASIARKARGR